MGPFLVQDFPSLGCFGFCRTLEVSFSGAEIFQLEGLVGVWSLVFGSHAFDASLVVPGGHFSFGAGFSDFFCAFVVGFVRLLRFAIAVPVSDTSTCRLAELESTAHTSAVTLAVKGGANMPPRRRGSQLHLLPQRQPPRQPGTDCKCES